jgi:hypothetical protein
MVLDAMAFSYNEYFMEDDPAFTASMMGGDIVLKQWIAVIGDGLSVETCVSLSFWPCLAGLFIT